MSGFSTFLEEVAKAREAEAGKVPRIENLRDYFAGQALAGFCNGGMRSSDIPGSVLSCYKIADAMLKARGE